jgi:hypothetical protein
MGDYTLFNLYEAIFWIILGAFCYVIGKYLSPKYKSISIFSSFIFILFGISDFIEIKTQGFLYPIIWWLLVWKVVGVIAIVFLIIWYLRLRLKE